MSEFSCKHPVQTFFPAGPYPMGLLQADPQTGLICSPEVQGWEFSFYPAHSSQDLELHYGMVTAGKVAVSLHIASEPSLICEDEVHQDTSLIASCIAWVRR